MTNLNSLPLISSDDIRFLFSKTSLNQPGKGNFSFKKKKEINTNMLQLCPVFV